MALIYLDTNVFIRCFESGDVEAESLRSLFVALRDAPGAAVTSELTLAELLAPVKRRNALTLTGRRDLYGALLLWGGFIGLRAVDRDILIGTATLRQSFSLKLPDAIHVMTAQRERCALFMSDDADADRLPAPLRKVRPNVEGVAACVDALSASPGPNA